MAKSRRSMSYGKTKNAAGLYSSKGARAGATAPAPVHLADRGGDSPGIAPTGPERIHKVRAGESSADATARLGVTGGGTIPETPGANVPGAIPTDTGTPTPAPVEQGMPTPEQAQQNLLTGGLTGDTLKMAQASLSKYQQAHGQMVGSGKEASADGGVAGVDVAESLNQFKEPDTTNADNVISGPEGEPYRNLLNERKKIENSQAKVTSLMEDYKKFRGESGLDEINAEMIDAETILNGTEDDIRNEIQTAGGFGTDSQVQAMSLARNKGLLQRYNALAQMKSDATTELNMMMSLNQQDKQIAQQKMNNQIDNLYKDYNIVQNMQNAAKEQARWLTTTMGTDNVYNSLKGDPKRLSDYERLIGGSTGWMEGAAQQVANDRAMDAKIKQAQYNKLVAPEKDDVPTVKTINGVDKQWNPSTKTWDSIGVGAQNTDPVVMSMLADKIKSTEALSNSDEFARATGNIQSWFDFSRKKADFLATADNLISGITLDELGRAKAKGITFGALSEGEIQLVGAAATTLGNLAIRNKEGKITGFSGSPRYVKEQIDTLNKYAKINYIKMGGNAADIPSILSVGDVDEINKAYNTSSQNATSTNAGFYYQ